MGFATAMPVKLRRVGARVLRTGHILQMQPETIYEISEYKTTILQLVAVIRVPFQLSPLQLSPLQLSLEALILKL